MSKWTIDCILANSVDEEHASALQVFATTFFKAEIIGRTVTSAIVIIIASGALRDRSNHPVSLHSWSNKRLDAHINSDNALSTILLSCSAKKLPFLAHCHYAVLKKKKIIQCSRVYGNRLLFNKRLHTSLQETPLFNDFPPWDNKGIYLSTVLSTPLSTRRTRCVLYLSFS